jgi:uncharacterized protein (TIGR02996 family)
MIQGNGFLDTIRAAPEDDGPRLVYADWLEERGDPRGEFIRVQCVLEHMSDDEPTRGELEAREQEIFAEHGKEWTNSLPGKFEADHFRRGFLSTIDVDAPGFLESAAAWFAREPIEHVLLHDVEDYVTDLAACRQLAHVRILDLSRCGIGAADAVFLAESPYLNNLRTLDLSGSHIGTQGVKALAASPHLAELTALLLDGNDIGASGMEALAASTTLLKLTILDVSRNSLGDAGLHVLIRSRRLESLQQLLLACNRISSPTMRTFANCPRAAGLITLDLSENDLGNDGPAALAVSPHLGALQSLDLTACHIGASGVRTLARADNWKEHAGKTLLGSESNQLGRR